MEDQNENRFQKPEPKPSPRFVENSQGLLAVIFGAVVLAVGILIFYAFQSQDQGTPNSLESAMPNEQSGATVGEAVITKDESYPHYYRYKHNGKTLTYEQIVVDFSAEYDPVVTFGSAPAYIIYLTDNQGNSSEITQSGAHGSTGYNYPPEFVKTSNPVIALLRIRGGELGSFTEEFIYINIESSDILRVNNFSTPGTAVEIMVVETTTRESFSVDLVVTDNCGGINKPRIHGMTATLKDLRLNGKPQEVIDSNQLLTCVNNHGFSDMGFNENIKLVISGVSKNLAKVFFGLEIETWVPSAPGTGGRYEPRWQESYSLDLDTRKIKVEKPSDIL